MGKVIEETNGDVSEGTFFHHDKEWDSLTSQMSSMASKKRALRKRMKDDGIDIDDFLYQKKKRAKPVAEQVASYNRQLLYGQYWKMPAAMAQVKLGEINDELGLTDEQRQKKWQDDGFIQGRSGKGMDTSPHDPNSVAGRFWLEGWRDGQKKNAEGIKAKKNEKPAGAKGSATVTNIGDGPKRGRGRPPKNTLPLPPSGDDAGTGGQEPTVPGAEPAAPPADGTVDKNAEEQAWDAADPTKAKGGAEPEPDPFAEPSAPPGSTVN